MSVDEARASSCVNLLEPHQSHHTRVAVIEAHDRYTIKYPFGASFIFRTFMQIEITQHKHK